MIDKSRAERLRAMRAEVGDDEDDVAEEDRWGGSDEEPNEAQRELMRRTATHILSSPNPAQLEMRILANHGPDKRFAFLRGRWSRAWKVTKGYVKLSMETERVKKEKEKEEKIGLGGLTGYASDSDGANSEGDAEEDTNVKQTELAPSVSDDAVKEARRVKAKEWAEKRRALKARG